MSIIYSIGPPALLLSLVSVALYYFIYRAAPEPKRHPSVRRYLLVVLGAGVLAYVVGAIVGISAACSAANAGNLCGLVGIFGVGPLLSAGAIFVYAHLWAKNARRPP